MAEPFIRIENLVKAYQRDTQTLTVLSGLNLAVDTGEFLALMGPSGSGKTTLLNLIAGIDRPTSGRINVGGLEIDGMGEAALAKWRSRNVGFIFQLYNLVPVLTAFENVELPLLLTDLPRARRRKQVELAL
jgi:putative ABC transport system ATP-binding protein